MRVMMPFTLVARKVNNSIIIYYRYRKQDMTLSSLLSTGIKAENDTEKAIQSAKRKANLICMELYRSGKIHQESEILLKTYTKDFFTEKCKYIQWKISTGSKERKGLTQSTIVFYRRILRCQILPYLGNVPLKRLNAAKIKNFLISLKEKFSNKTINHTILVLNIILKQAVEENIIQSNPASNVSRLRVDKPNMNLYTFEELRALFNPYLEKEDVNPAKIRAVMGHKDSTMTGLYTNWNANEFPEVYTSQRKLVNAIGGNDERYQEG